MSRAARPAWARNCRGGSVTRPRTEEYRVSVVALALCPVVCTDAPGLGTCASSTPFTGNLCLDDRHRFLQHE
jgi:hypothetical protein